MYVHLRTEKTSCVAAIYSLRSKQTLACLCYPTQEGEVRASALVRRLFEAANSADETSNNIPNRDKAKSDVTLARNEQDVTRGVVTKKDTSLGDDKNNAAVDLPTALDSTPMIEGGHSNEDVSRHVTSSGGAAVALGDKGDVAEPSTTVASSETSQQGAMTAAAGPQIPTGDRETADSASLGQRLSVTGSEGGGTVGVVPVGGFAQGGVEQGENDHGSDGRHSSGESTTVGYFAGATSGDGGGDVASDTRPGGRVPQAGTEGQEPGTAQRDDKEHATRLEGEAPTFAAGESGGEGVSEQAAVLPEGMSDDDDASGGPGESRSGGGDDGGGRGGGDKDAGNTDATTAEGGPSKKGWSWGWSVPTWVGGGKNE